MYFSYLIFDNQERFDVPHWIHVSFFSDPSPAHPKAKQLGGYKQNEKQNSSYDPCIQFPGLELSYKQGFFSSFSYL